ncbi:hypothetical protein L484_024915 [Morus notabilis]|uniref:SWIM-type domain-containing protein n=1 Tax=Morus notabilis TaxID=981085 RepID=W9RBI0_9ROSA|nr:uncharacterized protein LOC21407635 [Morus notabilis]EXB66619.1 hypothetical protein L484_024915 [Morus notabilis]
MVKPKLILICQSLGEFVTNDDGTLSYNGGEAHAVDITPETLFDDLKLKLAEMWNLQYDSLSIKYFLPGNRRTLITVANDRDLKRMYEFHSNSITADVFIQGKAGFVREALPLRGTGSGRTSGLKVAETVMPIAAVAASLVSMRPSAVPAAVDHSDDDEHPSRDDDVGDDNDDDYEHPSVTTIHPTGSGAVTPNANANDSVTVDMDATPADTVKKRRRVASSKSGASPPVVATSNVGKKTKSTPRRKNVSKRKSVIVLDEQEGEQGNYNGNSLLGSPNDLPPEKLVALWKKAVTGVDQEFKSVYEFREALQKYAVAHHFTYRLKKNDTNRASGRCVAEGCSWRIYASWDSSSQTFKIKSMNKTHTCGGESWKAAHPAKNWVVSIIKDRLQGSPHHKPKEIAKSILRDFGVELNYTQVWRGIGDARAQLQGSYKEAYNQLPWLCEKMAEANPGSLIKLFTTDDKRFHRLFLSFHASIHGFQMGCRPIIFLEATSLKSKYHEILLSASALDGDDGIFPVAFAIVDTENCDNWHWFLEQLRSAFSTSQAITFVSDSEKDLEKSVLEVFENAHHGYSIYHLSENLKRNSKGPFYGDGKSSLRINLLAAAHAVRVDFFQMHTEQIKRVCSQAYDWLMQIKPEYWTSALFKGEPYNHVTVNVAESYANWIEEVRESPITQKIEALRSKTSELINSRRTDSSVWSARLVPSKEGKLQEQRNKAHGLKVLFSSETLFEVQGDSTHVVDTDKRSCTCKRWKPTGLPCSHAIAVFSCTGRNVYDYCSRYFTVDSFRFAYSESINPVVDIFKPSNDEKADSESSCVLPPQTLRPPSQHKNKKEGETESQEVVKKTRRIVTCAKCKGTGHNKATCKAD